MSADTPLATEVWEVEGTF